MMKAAAKTKGRPRAFDIDQALDKALQVFWRKGYDSASMADLTEAMGINAPSLYAAFGNKETLFRKAVERYAREQSGFVERAMAAPTAREAATALLQGAATYMTGRGHPKGCLIVRGSLAGADTSQALQHELIQRRDATEIACRKRFERAIREGDLPSDADPAALARYLMTVNQGMSVQATSGASRAELLQVVEIALKGWPG
jgi:AcrR family transcriptional regulator